MSKGIVSSFGRAAGYGFAVPENPRDTLETKLFLHHSEIQGARKFLVVDDEIEYEIGERNGRTVAKNIRILKSALPVSTNGDDNE
jgi:cold shock CspA family protein